MTTRANRSIGVDLGGTTIKFALLDEAGDIVVNDRIATDGEDGSDAVIRRMAEGAFRMLEATDAGVDAIGVAVPGLIDMNVGMVRFLTNLPGHWPNVKVTEPITDFTGVPAFLINDVRAFTLAELRRGAAQGITTGIFYAVGTGIGGGIVTHGQVNFGVAGASGELGHTIVDPAGPICGCGNRGCVEALAAGPAIIGEANRRIVSGAATVLREMVEDDLNRMVPELVEEAAQAGDSVACEVLDSAGHAFGIAIASMIAAIAPEVVVIGGGVMEPDGYYWNRAVEVARSHTHVSDIDRVEFKPAAFSFESGVIGAGLWGRDVAAGRAQPPT